MIALNVISAMLLSALVASPAIAHDSNSGNEPTRSKRIEVYSLSQNYWDTQTGDTLGNIVIHLLPNNPSKHEALKQDIIRLNPQAFIDNDASRLLAGKRLWLPGYMKQADSRIDPATTSIESFSWGNIKRDRRSLQ